MTKLVPAQTGLMHTGMGVRLLNDRAGACKAVIRHIESHQLYDKDSKGLLKQAIAKAEGE